MRKLILLLCTGVLILSATAQDLEKSVSKDQSKISIGAVYGMHFYNTSSLNQDYLRGSISSYSGTNTDFYSSFSRLYSGVKIERQLKNKQIIMSTGIIYSKNISDLYSESNYSSDFFYVRHKQEGTNTNYLRVNSLAQESHFIGVPIQGKFLFNYRPRLRIYFKAGIDFNYQLSSSNVVKFKNSDMNKYSDDVSALMGNVNKMYVSTNFGGGVRLGQKAKPHVNIEFNFSTSVLTKNPSTISKVNASGAGFQTSLMFPL